MRSLARLHGKKKDIKEWNTEFHWKDYSPSLLCLRKQTYIPLSVLF